MLGAHRLIRVPPPGHRLRREPVHARVRMVVCERCHVAFAAVSGLHAWEGCVKCQVCLIAAWADRAARTIRCWVSTETLAYTARHCHRAENKVGGRNSMAACFASKCTEPTAEQRTGIATGSFKQHRSNPTERSSCKGATRLVDGVVHDAGVRLLRLPQVVVARRQHQVEIVDVRQPRYPRLEVPADTPGWAGRGTARQAE